MNNKDFNIENFNTSQNVFIEASAGTGKTYTIQQIVAKMIFEGDKLENILIVTFTEKAAGELKDRIRRKIEEVVREKKLEGKSLSDEDVSRFYEELNNVDNAPIFTIHGFCQKTLSEFAFAVKRTSTPGFIDETEYMTLNEKLIRDEFVDDNLFRNWFIANENSIPNMSMMGELIHKYYADFSGKEDSSIISLQKSDLKFMGQTLSPEDWVKVFSAEKPEDLYVIDGVEDAFNYKGSSKYQSFIDDVKTNIENGKYTTSLFSGTTFKINSFSGEEGEHFKVFYDLKAEFKKYKKGNLEVFEKSFAYENLLKLYNKWQKEKELQNVQSYDDMIRTVRENLKPEDSELRVALQRKYKHAIIDEFQDTNQKQWDIFKSVFLQDENHSLIVVGDPKQSIYSFQEADLEVYKSAISEVGSKGSGATLRTNYRSTNSVINSCNHIFSIKADNADKAEGGSSLFFSDDDSHKNIIFEDSLPPSQAMQKKDAEYFDEKQGSYSKTKAVWIAQGSPKEKPKEKAEDNEEKSEKDVAAEKVENKENELNCIEDASEYAAIVTQTIIDCCTYVDGKTKLQIFDKSKPDRLRNVTFHDFVVLGKTRYDFPDLEYSFKKAGIPFTKYKDSNLFSGKECADWISLFKAINVPDFTGRNQAALREAIFTSFFDVPLDKLDDPKYTETTNKERNLFISWKNFAQKREWSLLLEHIYSETQIEERLSKLDKLQQLTKIRQIGNYIVEYLYNNDSSVDMLVKHLSELADGSDEAEGEDGNLVQTGTDFDCVQFMTMHASKGLEFPVVICSGTPATKRTDIRYHDENGLRKLCLNGEGDSISKAENLREQQRIFYVAYTRASSLLILPLDKKDSFLTNSLKAFIKKGADYKFIQNNKKTDYDLKKAVQNLLLEKEKTASSLQEDDEETQRRFMTEVAEKIPELEVRSFSYSSLSKKTAAKEEIQDDEGRINQDDDLPAESTVRIFDFDKSAVPVQMNYDFNRHISICDRFPKGMKAGNAIHKVFEKSDFKKIAENGNEAFLKSESINQLIEDCFEEQTLSFKDDLQKEIVSNTKSILWNTISASLPEIKGSSTTGKEFCLKEIEQKFRLPEVEFQMNNSNKDWMNKFTKGFIDLLFVRNDVYSIVDWKSDSLDSADYSKADVLKAHINNHYAIQRVLYSYSLIKWLSYFYKDETEEQIFQNHFGGIYYVLVKGCYENTGNGIYAQTWNSWTELKAAFEEIKSKLMGE